jgi:hypothetical protein
MMTSCSNRGPAPTARRPRGAALAVEAMEKRLAPSAAVGFSPPLVPAVVLNFPHNPGVPTNPCTGGGTVSRFPHNPD